MFDAELMTERMEVFGAGSGVVCTVGHDGEPRVARAWGVTVVDAASGRIRLMMGADDPIGVDNLRSGRISVTGTDVHTLLAVQLKGRVVSTRAPDHDDIETLIRHSSAFFRAVHAIDGLPLALLERMLPAELVVVDVEVDEVFDQTPGPSAGSPIRRTSS